MNRSVEVGPPAVVVYRLPTAAPPVAEPAASEQESPPPAVPSPAPRVRKTNFQGPSGVARLERMLRASRIEEPLVPGSGVQLPEALALPVFPEGWTSVGRGVSVWVEMVRPAEDIVKETILEHHDVVRDPTLWSLAWAFDVDAQTALFASISASRQLDEAVTDSMFDPDYAWFGLGVLFRF